MLRFLQHVFTRSRKQKSGLIILKLAHLVFEFEAQEDCSLPVFMGPMLRGAFGFSLKRLVCVMRGRPCDGCTLEFACAYPSVFSPSPSPMQGSKRVYSKLPPPVVLRVFSVGGFIKKGMALKFSVTLIGNAIGSIPYVVRTFIEAGQLGFGKDRAKFKFVALDDKNGSPWLDAQGRLLLRSTISEAASINDDVLVSFVSPLRLVHDGHLMTPGKFDSAALVFSSIRRAAMLAEFYCETKFENVPALKNEASKVRLIAADLRWQEEARFSSRQKTKLMVGGLSGQVHLNLTNAPEVKSFIAMLPEIGLGKATTMGLGAVDVVTATQIETV